jgi:hypothetical protein
MDLHSTNLMVIALIAETFFWVVGEIGCSCSLDAAVFRLFGDTDINIAQGGAIGVGPSVEADSHLCSRSDDAGELFCLQPFQRRHTSCLVGSALAFQLSLRAREPVGGPWQASPRPWQKVATFANIPHMPRTFGTAAFLVVLAVLLFGSAQAEDSKTFRNERGQEIGRSITRGNTTTLKDAMGREIGRSERRGDGTTIYYDERGRSLGSSREKR